MSQRKAAFFCAGFTVLTLLATGTGFYWLALGFAVNGVLASRWMWADS